MSDLPFVPFPFPSQTERTLRGVPLEQIPPEVHAVVARAVYDAQIELGFEPRQWELFYFEDVTPEEGFDIYMGKFDASTPNRIYINAHVPLELARSTTRHEMHHAWQHDQGLPDDDAAAREFAKKGSASDG